MPMLPSRRKLVAMPRRLLPCVLDRVKPVSTTSPFLLSYLPFGTLKAKRPYHWDTRDEERGARPLYFQQSPIDSPETSPKTNKYRRHQEQNSLLPFTPYDFLGTTSVLPPHARHLSPCLGAALAASPLAGNLMRLGQRGLMLPHDESHNDDDDNCIDKRWAKLLSRIGFLANNLFFQLIRESPIHMVRNKSMPAAYLTPGIIGCFLSNQQSNNTLMNDRVGNEGGPNDILKAELRHSFGIRSNRIYDTQWTGISLARWMDLVIPTDSTTVGKSDVYDVYQQSLVSALWLIALWGVTPSKESLFDYYESLKRARIANCWHPAGGSTESNNKFTENDFAPHELKAAMNRLLEYYSPKERNALYDDNDDDNADDDDAIARAFELVCGAIVLQQQDDYSSSPPPIIPNGYFSFDGGDTKADCAEVVVREILTLLLWDETEGTMDCSRLPMPSPELTSLLQGFNRQLQQVETNAAMRKEQDLGQAWFDLLSDLPHCDYLAVSPNGRAFELAPSSESISAALWHLLVGGVKNETQTDGKPWTSLHELETYWSQHHPSKPLIVKHERLKHQSGDGILMEHELISLHLHDNSRVIELRLRCDFERASGMAAVTHLTKPRQKPLLDPKQVQELQSICFRFRAHRDPSLVLLCLALQNGHHDLSLPHVEDDTDDSLAALGTLPWLASSYGADRRELRALCGDASSDRDRKDLKESRRILKERILHACRLCDTYPMFGAQLLLWLLHESPIVVETFNDDIDRLSDTTLIQQALLSLPASAQDDQSMLEAIEWNWACIHRGRLLVRIIQWKLRKLSLWQALSRSNVPELIELFSMSRCMKQSIGKRY